MHVYRLLSAGTMEEKIYSRQITKQGLAARVVDEHQARPDTPTAELSVEPLFTRLADTDTIRIRGIIRDTDMIRDTWYHTRYVP